MVGRGDRVHGIHQVKVDGPVIGIDNHLYRIADVVEVDALRGLRIGKIAARRIGILHPEQPPIVDHQIGVVVEAQERGDRAYPFPDVAAEHDPAVAGDVAREQQVHILEVPGEEDSPRDPAHGNAARAVIGRVDIIFPLRIVELRRAPLDDDVAVRLFPVVDARLADFGAAGRDRRN